MTAERLCDHCGTSLGDEVEAHVCPESNSDLRATKADTPSGMAGGNGKEAAPTPPPGPTAARVTVQTAAPEAPRALAAPPRPEPPPDKAAPVRLEEDDGYDPLIGTLLGEHYRIVERLGRGGMGTVYLVTHIHLKKKFAAKILNTETVRRPDALARFQQEAVSASKLDHENIVDIVNFGKSEDGTPYLIMEFLRGETLNQILAKGPLGFDDTIRVVVPMCHALAAAHGAGIVHRDLKPENVFVSRRSGTRHVIKLLDFGISKIKQSQFEERSRLTQTGDVLGSPLYMSPEAARGEADVDSRADIYAIGVLLYEMTTGRVPFAADNYLQVLYKHIQEEPPSPRDRNPAMPPALDAVILKCLAKHPEDRYQRVEELEAALLAAVPGVDLGLPISAAAPPIPTTVDVPIQGSPSAELDAVSSSGARTPAPMAAVTPVSQSGGRSRPPGINPTTGPALVLPPPPESSSRMGLAAGFVGTLGVLGFGAYLLWQMRQPGDDAEIVHTSTAVATPAPAASAAPAPVVIPARPERAELTVETTPPGAAVTLDGAAVGVTPLTMTLDPEERERTLRVELSGFRAESRAVVLDRSQAVAVELKKILARDKPDTPRPPPLDIKEGR